MKRSSEGDTIIVFFSLYAIIAFALYASYYAWQDNYAFTYLYVATSLYVVANFALFRRFNSERSALYALALIGLPVLLPWQITGGIGGSGIFFYYLYIAGLFYILGRRKGLMATCGLFVISIALYLLQRFGYFESPYSFETMGPFYFGFAFQAALVYTFQDSKDRAELILKDQSVLLADQSGELRRQIQQREQLDLALKAHADELEKTKQATLNILEDLSAEKIQLEAAKAKDDAILGGIGDGFVVTDANGAIIFVNHEFEESLGWTALEAQGRLLTELIPVQDEQGRIVSRGERAIVRVLATGKGITRSTSAPYYYIRKDGSRLPATITVTPILEGGVATGAVEIFRDVTKEEEVDRAKTEFVSLASHQLRTPLSAIGWYSEMLMAGDAGPMTDDQKDYLKEIHDGNVRMVDLVNSLLNVSRLELGTFAVEPELTDLVAIVESVLSELAPQILSKNQYLEKKFEAGLPQVSVDRKLFRMIIQNLASNAVKYTPVGGIIGIELEKKDSDLLITVRDNGYGIPKNQQDKIFTKLFRADNIRKFETEGTGLGLYIVKSILDQSGGSVRFESEEGKGSTFFVTIPLSGMRSKEGDRKLS